MSHDNIAHLYASQGFGHTLGMGRSPAVLLIDFTIGFADSKVFGGGNIGAAVEQSRELLAYARATGIPVAHTKIVYAEDGSDANMHTNKVPSLLALTPSNPATDFVPELYPQRGEVVVAKRLPSAFFGTDLAAVLMSKGIDTLLIGGCTTSGCVRASVLDALCLGFRPIVIRDCVGDRAIGPHDANLFDIGQKYADVVTLAEVKGMLNPKWAVGTAAAIGV